MKLTVNLEKDSYPIIIEKGILDHVLDYIDIKSNKLMIITDSNVSSYYLEKIVPQLNKKYDVHYYIIEAGEKSKHIDSIKPIYEYLLECHITRTDTIIALGGGVVGDLAGFISSSYLRGVNFIQIPTSLLAQVDSSVGGKVGVDLDVGKNLVGAFKHPKLVLIDPNTLKTLPVHYIRDGMGEVIKYGCIFDKDFFNQLNNYDSWEALYKDIDEILYKCVNFKRIVVENDLYDFGDRLSLNFGHTLAHAIEVYYHYDMYSHGQAVGIGMYLITKLSEEKGLTKAGTSDKIKEILIKYHLPYSVDLDLSKLKEAMQLDKKNINASLSYVLLKEIGEYFIYPSDLNFINRE